MSFIAPESLATDHLAVKLMSHSLGACCIRRRNYDGVHSMMLRQFKRLCLACSALCVLAIPAHAAVELMDLINNNGNVVVGNIVFDQFSLVTSGDITPETEVNVISITDANGNHGIRFQGGLADLPNNGPSSWTVGYQASSLDGTSIFTGATLAANTAAIVSGSGSVTLSADQLAPANTSTFSMISTAVQACWTHRHSLTPVQR